MIRVLARQARSETRIPALFLQGRGKDGTWLRAVRHRIRRHSERFSRCRDFKRKTKRSPALSSQSRAGRAPRAAGAPLLWIAWRMVRRKAQRVERGEKTKRTKKVWRRCSKLFNLLFQNSLLPSLFLLLSLPSSSFLSQPRRRPSLHPLFYVRDGGRDKENEENVATVQRTVLSSLSKQSSSFSFSAPFSSLVLFTRPLSSATLREGRCCSESGPCRFEVSLSLFPSLPACAPSQFLSPFFVRVQDRISNGERLQGSFFDSQRFFPFSPSLLLSPVGERARLPVVKQ
jgi:hypothetical protein